MHKHLSKQGFRELRSKLQAVTGRHPLSPVEKFNQSISLINEFLQTVREQVTSVAFKDQWEEIYFFKFEKPEYYALKIYQVALFTLQNQKPVGTAAMIRDYYLDELAFRCLVSYGKCSFQVCRCVRKFSDHQGKSGQSAEKGFVFRDIFAN